MNQKDIYDNLKLKKTLWSPWFILKGSRGQEVKGLKNYSINITDIFIALNIS